MEGPFLSTPAKRPFHLLAAGDKPDLINGDSTSSKRRRSSKIPPPPINVSQAQTSFRLLCPAAKTGGVIGKSGSIVKLFQKETGAKIRIEEAVPGCDERVILIVAPSNKKKPSAGEAEPESENNGAKKLGEDISSAQEALVRVFERILYADGEQEFPAGVACRLLAAKSQVGCVLGKGGKIIEKIKKESGTKIRVLTPEQVPACASPNDEVIQIVGDISAVKKAIMAVSRCLQDNPPSEKVPISASRPVGAVAHETYPDARNEPFSQRTSLLMTGNPNLGFSFGSSNDYVSTRGRAGEETVPTLDEKKTQQEVAFRLLCSNDRVGGVIGKGGSIVRAIQSETGATVSVGASVAESDERVITVSALENPESRLSPAQNALVRVFTRSIEAAMEKRSELGQDKATPVSARLLVPSNQIGCLLGKGGKIIAEMRRITGSSLRIFGCDQVPKCASENDQLLQINGDLGIVQDALVHVTGRLRDNLFPGKTINGAGAGIYSSSIPEIASYGRVREPTSPGPYRSLGFSHNLDRPSTLSHSLDHSYLQAGDHTGLSHSFDRPSPPRLWSSQVLGSANPRGITDIGKGLTPLRGGLELGSGSKIAIVTNTTVEIVVPEHVIGLVYGENGSNLSRIRKISGAKVVVHDPRPGTSEGVVIISGTPDQTQAAQSLLQAFILSGQASPDPHSRFL